MIPKDLSKPLSQIKAPGIRGWIISLLIAISALTTVVVWQWRATNAGQKSCEKKVEELEQKILDMQNATIQRLQKKTDEADSLNRLAQKIISK